MVNSTTLLAAGAGLAVAEATGATNLIGGKSGGGSDDNEGTPEIPNLPPVSGGGPTIDMPSIKLPKIETPDVTLQRSGVSSQLFAAFNRQNQTIENLENKIENATADTPGLGAVRLAMLRNAIQNASSPTDVTIPDLTPGSNGGLGDKSGGSNYTLHKQGLSNPVKAGFEILSESGEFVTNNPGTTAAALAAPFTGASSLLLAGPAADLTADHWKGFARGAARGTDIAADIATGGTKGDTIHVPGPTLRQTENAINSLTKGPVLPKVGVSGGGSGMNIQSPIDPSKKAWYQGPDPFNLSIRDETGKEPFDKTGIEKAGTPTKDPDNQNLQKVAAFANNVTPGVSGNKLKQASFADSKPKNASQVANASKRMVEKLKKSRETGANPSKKLVQKRKKLMEN